MTVYQDGFGAGYGVLEDAEEGGCADVAEFARGVLDAVLSFLVDDQPEFVKGIGPDIESYLERMRVSHPEWVKPMAANR